MKSEKWKGMFVEIEDFMAVDDGSVIEVVLEDKVNFKHCNKLSYTITLG